MDNTFVYMHTTGMSGVRAELAIGAAPAWDNLHVMVGGSAFLDIIQIGVRMTATGPRVFAANGRGEPNGPDSSYKEWDFGSTGTGWHEYKVVWSTTDSCWRLSVDGIIKHTLPAQVWTTRTGRAVAESEPPATKLGGTTVAPMRVRLARARKNGAWVLPDVGSMGPGSWHVGGYAVPAGTDYTFGKDWLNVTR